MIDKIECFPKTLFSFKDIHYKRITINVIFPSVYFLIFLFIFIYKYPTDSLPGISDVILNINIFNQYVVLLKNLFYEQSTAFYPYKWFILLGDPIPLLAIIFHSFKLLLQNDFYSYKAVLILIFSLNAYSVALLSSNFFKKGISYFTAGLLFATNSYLFNLNDNINVLFFAPGILALHFIFRKKYSKYKDFVWGGILLSGQMLCGVYISYMIILITILGIIAKWSSNNSSEAKKITVLSLGITTTVFVLMFTPIVYYQITHSAINPITYEYCRDLFSLHIEDFLRTYKADNFDPFNPYLNTLHAAFPGIMLSIVAFAALVDFNAVKYFIIIFLIGIVLALGPEICFDGKCIPNFLSPHYYLHFLCNVIRIPGRFFLISILAMCLMGGAFINYLFKRSRGIALITFLFVTVFQMHYSFKLSNRDAVCEKDILPSKFLLNILTKCNGPVFFLPSGASSLKMDKQQYTYMYWKKSIPMDIVNGNNGFIPQERISVYHDIDAGNYSSLLNTTAWNTLVILDSSEYTKLNCYIVDNDKYKINKVDYVYIIEKIKFEH